MTIQTYYDQSGYVFDSIPEFERNQFFDFITELVNVPKFFAASFTQELSLRCGSV